MTTSLKPVFQHGLPREFAGLLIVMLLTVGQARAQVILYSDNFSGLSSTNLAGTAPDISFAGATLGANHGTGGNWAGNTNFKADGSVTGTTTNASAALPFSPQNGYVYTLRMTTNYATTAADWQAAGFFTNTTGTALATGGGISRVWGLTRPGDPVNTDHVAHFNLSGGGGNIGSNFAGALTASAPTTIDIILNTGDGTGLWDAQWYFNGALLATQSNFNGSSIGAVGIGANYTAADSDRFTNFQLSVAAVPEPSSGMLWGGMVLGLAGFGVYRARRKP